VALKCISKKNRSTREVNNLKTETNLLTKINNDNIIGLKECFETETELIVVMEYAGTDLSELLKKEHKLPEDKIRLFARQILNAMLYLNENKIAHRDLKPQNILLEKNTIKICDFGFAKQMSDSTNFLRSIKGTPLYIAP
jgi:fused